MVERFLILLFLIVGAAMARPASAADAPAPADDSFERFSLIVYRNIFDPNRTPARRSQSTTETTPAADTIDLLGAFIDQGVAVAFTEGSNSENSRTIKVGDLIAEMKVVSITTAGIQLEAGSQKLDWPVGKRLSRREGESWTLGADSPSFRSSNPASSSREGRGRRSGNRTGMSQSTQATPSNPADTLARLRERRRREMGQ